PRTSISCARARSLVTKLVTRQSPPALLSVSTPAAWPLPAVCSWQPHPATSPIATLPLGPAPAYARCRPLRSQPRWAQRLRLAVVRRDSAGFHAVERDRGSRHRDAQSRLDPECRPVSDRATSVLLPWIWLRAWRAVL